MIANDPRQLEERQVEEFLAPLSNVAPASRANGRRRARSRVHKLVLLAVVLIGLLAGIAVASNDGYLVTLVDTNGNSTTTREIPVEAPPPANDNCRDPSCIQGRGDVNAGQKARGAATPDRQPSSGR